MGKKIGKNGIVRFTASVEPEDLDLLDRLARLGDSNRSEQLRMLLESLRPTLSATVRALEAAQQAKESFLEQAGEIALEELTEALPEIEKVRTSLLGAMARLEGLATANPRGGNHGGQNGNRGSLNSPFHSLDGENYA